jgi:hypothetical protein
VLLFLDLSCMIHTIKLYPASNIFDFSCAWNEFDKNPWCWTLAWCSGIRHLWNGPSFARQLPLYPDNKKNNLWGHSMMISSLLTDSMVILFRFHAMMVIFFLFHYHSSKNLLLLENECREWHLEAISSFSTREMATRKRSLLCQHAHPITGSTYNDLPKCD